MDHDDILNDAKKIILASQLFLESLEVFDLPSPSTMNIISTQREFCVLFTWDEPPFTAVYVNISYNQLSYTFRCLDDPDRIEQDMGQWGNFVYDFPHKLKDRLIGINHG